MHTRLPFGPGVESDSAAESWNNSNLLDQFQAGKKLAEKLRHRTPPNRPVIRLMPVCPDAPEETRAARNQTHNSCCSHRGT
jgi:hypothetical protein